MALRTPVPSHNRYYLMKILLGVYYNTFTVVSR